MTEYENENNIAQAGAYQSAPPAQPAPPSQPKKKKKRIFLWILRGLFYPFLYTQMQSLMLYGLVFIKAMAKIVGEGTLAPAYIVGTFRSILYEDLYYDLEAQYITSIVAAVTTLLIIIIIQLVRRKNLVEEFHLHRIGAGIAALAAATGFVLNFFVSFVMAHLPLRLQELIEYELSGEPDYNGSAIVYILAAVVSAPIIEELVFRNFEFTRFKEAVPVWLAILGSSVLFGIAHGSFTQGIYAGLLGILLAVVFQRSGSILTGMLVHFGFNLSSVISLIYTMNVDNMSDQGLMLFNLIYNAVTYLSAIVVIPLIAALVIKAGNKQKSKKQAEDSLKPLSAPDGAEGGSGQEVVHE